MATLESLCKKIDDFKRSVDERFDNTDEKIDNIDSTLLGSQGNGGTIGVVAKVEGHDKAIKWIKGLLTANLLLLIGLSIKALWGG